MENIGKMIVVLGAILVSIGLVIWLLGNKFTWFGNLPGDIRVERQNFKFYAPVASMLLISVVITLILWIVRKLF